MIARPVAPDRPGPCGHTSQPGTPPDPRYLSHTTRSSSTSRARCPLGTGVVRRCAGRGGHTQRPTRQNAEALPRVVISKKCQPGMAASQPIAYKQGSHGVFEKQHDMECTTQFFRLTPRVVNHIMPPTPTNCTKFQHSLTSLLPEPNR